jgi:Arc/MetJ-type ribon-helix-helix transcriptional regulator
MPIELRPELQALIQKRMESGAFSNPEEVIERALEFLATEEDWLAANRSEIAAQIQEGWDEAMRGELIDGDDVRAEMAKQKQAWLAQHPGKA